MLDALLLNERDIRAILAEPGTTRSAISALDQAIAAHGRGEFESPTRLVVGGGGEQSGRSLRVLPCIAPSAGGAACRVYTTNKSGRADAPAPSELILLYDGETMALRALIEDYSLHALRTGAPSAVAVAHLAPPTVGTIAVIGSGRQARGQLAAVATVRPPARVLVYSRDARRRATFAAEMTEIVGVPVVAAASPAEALRDAEVVLVATNTATPAVERRWLRADAIVVSIAPCELAEDVVRDAQLVACAAAEVLHGTPRWEPVASLAAAGEVELDVELGPLVAGTATVEPGRLTVVLSTGMAFWDVAIADWVDRQARERGLGTRLWPSGGARTDAGFATPEAGR